MEIVKGYKRTEVGLIPEEWKIHKVKDLIDLLTDYDANGSFESVAQNVNVYDHEEYAWYVRSTDLENNSKLDKVRYVDESSYKFLKKTSLNGGELLFLKRGDIGNVYLFEMKTQKATVAPNLYLLKLNQISDSKYLFYYFISNYGQRQLKSKNASSTLGALYKDDVKSILVPLPPTIAEQNAIANSLSNIDLLISQTEKLIDKKKAIKQGVMQELLKPKEGWVKVSIKEISKVGRGRVINQNEIQKSLGGKYPVYSSQTSNYGIMGFIDSYDFDGEYITWTTDGENAGTVFYRNGKFNCTNVCGTIKLKNFNARFIAYVLAIEAPKHVSRNLANPKLMNEPMKNIEILIPSDINTQSNIATILLTIENEIDLHVGKLNKLKLKKQGMMQALLTGKIRML